MNDPLTWESTYGIALALKEKHTSINLEDVSLNQVYRWTLQLPEFQDDPQLANDDILAEIYQNWLEEILNDDK